MSSKPSEAGAQLVASILSRREYIAREIDELQSKVQRLKRAEEEYAAASALLWDVMQAMDVHTTHNSGWEGRMTWFLSALAKKSRNASAAPPPTVEELRALFKQVVTGAASFAAAHFEKAFGLT